MTAKERFVSNQACLLVRAARREAVERTPVWFMRQAGRILPEYRVLRERWSLLEICRKPELCAEVTLQPVRRIPVDGAVLFADIMLPLMGIGVDLDLVDNVGPVIRHPIRDRAGLAQLRPITPEADVPFVLETIRLVQHELGGRIALIGFSGAPFTLASYLIEGQPSREFLTTKTLMYHQPDLWHDLMDRLTAIMIPYLQAQATAGVDVLQLFDSWVGALSPRDYATYVQPYTRRIFAALAPTGLPFIHFGTNTAGLLDLMKDDGGTLIGVDWRVPLDVAWTRIGPHLGIQGNLDPAVLLAPPAVLEEQAAAVLRRAGTRPGHIFNLGHGLLPDTPIDNILRLVDCIHAESAQIRATTAAVAATR
jgi:uroporphyrinogen decarboxylase